MATVKYWLRALMEVVEVLFNSKQGGKPGRTWRQHLVPYEEGWAVRREGNKRVTSKHRKQGIAIRKAKTLARKYKTDVIIRRESGGIPNHIGYTD